MKREVLSCLALLVASVPARSGADYSCFGAVGEWTWFIGGKVSFATGGTALWTPGSPNIPPAKAHWTCVNGTYTVTWQNGFVDTLRLSADGKGIAGRSSTGASVTGVRVGPPAAPPPPTPTQAKQLPASPPGAQAGRPKGQWIQKRGPPQKGPAPFEGWDKIIEKNKGK